MSSFQRLGRFFADLFGRPISLEERHAEKARRRGEWVDSTVEIPCSSCRRRLRLDEVLKGLKTYWRDLDLAVLACAYCGSELQLRASNDEVSLGYIYAAGAPHFATVTPVNVPGLAVTKTDAGLLLEYAGHTFRVADLPR